MPKTSSIRPVVSMRYRFVTDEQTESEGWTDTTTACMYCASIASHGKNEIVTGNTSAVCVCACRQQSAKNLWPWNENVAKVYQSINNRLIDKMNNAFWHTMRDIATTYSKKNPSGYCDLEGVLKCYDTIIDTAWILRADSVWTKIEQKNKLIIISNSQTKGENIPKYVPASSNYAQLSALTGNEWYAVVGCWCMFVGFERSRH